MRIFTLLTLLLLIGCQPATPDLEEWIAEVMQRPGGGDSASAFTPSASTVLTADACAQ